MNFTKRVLLLTGILALLVLLGAASTRAAEQKQREVGTWYPSAETGLNLTQSSYSDNWSGGDRGSIVWTAIFNGGLENKLSRKVFWTNALKLAYGQTHQQVDDADGKRKWAQPQKSTDLFDFETVFRFTLDAWLDPFVSGRFESFFEDATDPDNRRLFLNPKKFKESAGVARQILDEEDRSLLTRLGLTLRQSSRRVFLNAAPDDATESVSASDAGIEWITDYKTKILQDRVSWTSKLTFYKPFNYSGDDPLETLTAAQIEASGVDGDVLDFTKSVDIDWENILTTQITKAISFNLYLRFLYDKYDNTVKPALNDAGDRLANGDLVKSAVRKDWQTKQTMAIGITYRFI